jgi:hypothetical protein
MTDHHPRREALLSDQIPILRYPPRQVPPEAEEGWGDWDIPVYRLALRPCPSERRWRWRLLAALSVIAAFAAIQFAFGG